jgi:uncharacterized membrane protein
MGHSHGHDNPRAPIAIRRALVLALLPFAIATAVGLVVLWPAHAPKPTNADLGFARYLVRGTVTKLVETPCNTGQLDDLAVDSSEAPSASTDKCATATIKLTSGSEKGRTIRLDVTVGPSSLAVRQGSKVVLNYEPSAPADSAYQIADNQRGRPMIALAVLFAVAVVLLGRKRGFAALIGLGMTFVVLVRFVLPALLAGESPVQVALVGASFIMFVSLYITHGFTVRTSVAVLGTLTSLLLTGLLAAVFTAASSFSGLASEEASFLGATQTQLDLRGLLLAGVVIGSLGVLDDVTVTQAAAVWELRAANLEYGIRDLYRAGVRIGREHIASTVNTLVLAYAGASLPLLILFTISGRGVADTLTSEVVATEVVRSLVGGIGLVASVPVTTAVAALVAVRAGSAVRRPGRWARGKRNDDEHDETVEWWSRMRRGDTDS